MIKRNIPIHFPGRSWFALVLLSLVFMMLGARAAYLQVLDSAHLQAEGEARYHREIKIAATRGMLIDRNGELLAVSTPVDSVWADPGTLLKQREQWLPLARRLGMKSSRLKRLFTRNQDRHFIYLKRHLPPNVAAKVRALGIPGVGLEREYRRYYPAGPVAGQAMGFTNIDDQGQEGLELAFNGHLAGSDGLKRVVRDRRGAVIDDVALIRPAVDGRDLTVSLDSRIQYLTYLHLDAARRRHKARAATAVVLAVKTGEILAMATVPGFNPNDRGDRVSARYRNRAVTDLFEPGSAVKPFTIAMALASGRFGPDSRIDTSPGILKIGKDRVKDGKNMGLLTVSLILSRSSNVGAAKLARSLPAQNLHEVLDQVGFGRTTGSGLPGEVVGRLPSFHDWRDIEHATLSFGYGLSATALQLAKAYLILANDGLSVPVTILRRSQAPIPTRVLPAVPVRMVNQMLTAAASDEGTGAAAQISQYSVAGKTGTVHKVTVNGYAEDRYRSIFAGFAPARNPDLVMVVVVDEPRTGKYYGGDVAAPVFAKVISGALRLRNVAPDKPHVNLKQAGRVDGGQGV